MTSKVLAKLVGPLLLLASLACARTTRAPEAPGSIENPQTCANRCEEDLRSCMGNTEEDSRYSTCMPENDACVTACYDLT